MDVYLGGRMKHYRQMHSVSQEELAKELNATLDKIKKYENGKTRMSATTIVKVSDVLSCHIFDLFGRYAGNGEEPIGEQRILNVLKCYKEKNSRKRATLMQAARHFSNKS